MRVLLAHAANEQAAAFYARFDFEPSPTDPLHLLLLLKDARTSCGRPAELTRSSSGLPARCQLAKGMGDRLTVLAGLLRSPRLLG